MKAVILAAGAGRRLWPLTNRQPKPMLPVANKPLLRYVVEAVAEAGIDDVILVVGHRRDRIQTYFGDGDDWGIDISYAIQEDQLGTGHAVGQARSLVDEEFLVLNGDRIVDASLISDIRETGRGDTVATVGVTRVPSPEEYGVVTLDNGQLEQIEEKPVGEPQSELINAGIYRFTSEIFPAIDDAEIGADGELGLTSILNQFADEMTVDCVRYSGRWLDVSYPWDLLTVNDNLLGERSTDDRQHVHSSATVTDRVHVSTGTSVGSNATVKRGTSLGPNVTVGANAVVSNAVVMQDATISDGAVVRDCIVGENATIGPNSTVPGGTTRVTVDETVHSDVTLGGVVGANTSLGGHVVLRPGAIIGDNVSVRDGTRVDGRVESNAVIYGG